MSKSTSQQVILLTAGGGNIGSRLVPMLLNDISHPKVVLPTSNATRLSQKYENEQSPTKSQLAVEEGNIQDPQWVESIMNKHGVTSVFLCLTGEDELITTLNFFDAMRNVHTVKHLVYLSICGDVGLDAIKAGALQNVCAGHVAIKFLTEAKLRHGVLPPTAAGGFTYTVIGPTLFFDNDLRSKESIMKNGLFNEPMTPKGTSRVDPADIALATYTALMDRGQRYHGEKFMIGSKHAYTLKEMKDLWSSSLKREIRVADATNEQDLRDCEEHFKEFRSAGWARDMKLMYELFGAQGYFMQEEDYEKQVKFLGKEPEDYGKFVRHTAAKWLKEES